MTSFSGVTFLCFVLPRFRLYAFVEAAALRSIVLPCAGAPIATHDMFSFFFTFVYLEMSLFRNIFLYHYNAVFSLYRVYVVRSFLLDGVFLPCDHGLDFLHTSLCENSIEKKSRVCAYSSPSS